MYVLRTCLMALSLCDLRKKDKKLDITLLRRKQDGIIEASFFLSKQVEWGKWNKIPKVTQNHPYWVIRPINKTFYFVYKKVKHVKNCFFPWNLESPCTVQHFCVKKESVSRSRLCMLGFKIDIFTVCIQNHFFLWEASDPLGSSTKHILLCFT